MPAERMQARDCRSAECELAEFVCVFSGHTLFMDQMALRRAERQAHVTAARALLAVSLQITSPADEPRAGRLPDRRAVIIRVTGAEPLAVRPAG